MDHVAQGFEVLGTLILAIGVLWSFVLAVLAWRRSRSGQRAFTVLRQAFGGTLLLALKILVAADLVRTVAEGIWETRGGRRPFMYGRLQSWVAFDRAIKMATERSRPADVARWTAERDRLYRTVMDKGWNAR